jgi:deazaflavin-dependent oxidoreductase (nitroreductase family)
MSLRQRAIIAFGKSHVWAYERSDGRIGSRLQGHDMALVWTTGRRTGQQRCTALLCSPRGDDIIVVASFYGAERHPAWYLNLSADSRCQVRFGRQKFDAIARIADGAEYDELWGHMLATRPQFGEYQQRTSRRIPVVVLSPST